jgi:hypothetical protein
MILRAEEEYYLKLCDNFSVACFRDMDEGKIYLSNLSIGGGSITYEKGISNLHHLMSYSPSLVEFDCLEHLKKELLGDFEKVFVVRLPTDYGMVEGLHIPNREVARRFWKIGERGKLL